MAEHQLKIRFWGVRGSIPAPAAGNLGYGGNTSCVEIRCPGAAPLIFDGGSGLRQLGYSLMNEHRGGGECFLFFTHFHWDHIQGVPFFVPLYSPDWNIHFHSRCEGPELQRILGQQMCPPFFPVPMPGARDGRTFTKVTAEGVHVGGAAIHPIPLNHPNGCTGYRIEAGGRSIVYATDHEHGNEKVDRGLIEKATGADLLIYDSQYTPEEYEPRRGWGHSTPQAGARIAQEAGVAQLILFHHEPTHPDDMVSRMVGDARRIFPNTIAAAEGWSSELPFH